MHDFGIRCVFNSRLALVARLNRFLLRESSAGNNIVLIIDEAQNLKSSLLEQVRLLSNLETEKEKLLQVILVGQPELNRRLCLHDLRQLGQRIMVRFHITPLEQAEIRNYINHRLSVAGSAGRIEFTDEAIRAISEFSGGTPRLINALCDRALLAGFVSESDIIDIHLINKCIGELHGHLIGESV